MDTVTANFNYEQAFKAHGKRWVQERIDRECIDFLEKFGQFLCPSFVDKNGKTKLKDDAMTVTQIRNVFGEIKRIESKLSFSNIQEEDPARRREAPEWKADYREWQKQEPAFQLLRPKIAYNAARELSKRRESRIKDFRTVLDMAHSHVNNHEDFKRFSQLVEGIIAYHKVYGGKD
ncbi:MAG TPA: type III-A CRISPR-associated protein Csm2 [Saprospiraceae bacterium]|nr:type III-A CRISPR-associated protein Csm2 [Saprospiraceae bacterium]